MLNPMCEGAADPGPETWKVIGHVPARRKPGPEEPVQRALFQIGAASDLHFYNSHGRKLEPPYLAFWLHLIDIDGDVIADASGRSPRMKRTLELPPRLKRFIA